MRLSLSEIQALMVVVNAYKGVVSPDPVVVKAADRAMRKILKGDKTEKTG